MKFSCLKSNSISPQQQSCDIDESLRKERESNGVRVTWTENYLTVGVAESNIRHEYANALKLANNETFAAKVATTKNACCNIL